MTTELQKRLEAKIKETGLSVAKFEKLAGVKRNMARNILTGQSQKPAAENLQALAKALGCTMGDLLGTSSKFASECALLEDLPIFEQTVTCVLALYRERNEKPSLDAVLKVIREVYVYTMRADPQEVDAKFADWMIEQVSS